MTLPKKAKIVANWKMYKTIAEAKQFLEAFTPRVSSFKSEVWIAPAFTALYACSQISRNTSLKIGAQNLSDNEEGAFTGEVSGKMIREAGCHFVIIGHSERRQKYHETNDLIQKKIGRALNHGLIPLLCIGETLEERKAGKSYQVLSDQITYCLEGYSADDLKDLVIAYEPVWAIGTGTPATTEMAQEAHFKIREQIKRKWGESLSRKIFILYGGSVKENNIVSLAKQPDIDGALVGGASLNYEEFAKLAALGCKS